MGKSTSSAARAALPDGAVGDEELPPPCSAPRRTRESATALSSAVAGLLTLIRSGRVAPGQRLVESDLMEELGLKRGVVREALRILAGDGIVQILPNRGARVRGLSKRDIIDKMEVIGALQLLTIKQALRRDPGELDFSGIRISRMEILLCMRSSGRVELLDAISRHQYALNELSGNPAISLAMRKLNMEHFGHVIANAIADAALSECAQANVTLADAIMEGRREELIALAESNHDLIMRAVRTCIMPL